MGSGRRLCAAAAGAAGVWVYSGSAHADAPLRCERNQILMTYKGKLYDAAPFAAIHPGGEALIYAAQNNDLEEFFEMYRIHKDNPRVEEYLTALEVDESKYTPPATLAAARGPQAVTDGHARTWFVRRVRVLCAAACMPLLLTAIWTQRAVRFILSPLVYIVMRLVPQQPVLGRPKRVAVIGGGIAGCGAAYALSTSPPDDDGFGYEVTVYETRKTLGGNATTFEWAPGKSTGLAVLAWPAAYFRNYCTLLDRIGVASEEVTLPYYIHSSVEGYEGTFDQLRIDENVGTQRDLRVVFADDLRKWDRAVETVRATSDLLCGSRTSLYKSSYLNPFNYINLRTLIVKVFGCSEVFWDVLVVSQHGASFLTPELDSVPATILPVIDDLIPLNGVPGATEKTTMRSWSNTSADVFRAMTSKCDVKTNARVLSITTDGEGSAVGNFVRGLVGLPPSPVTHTIVDAEGECDDYDAIVFACNATSAATMLRGKSWIERALLNGVEYTDDTDLCWVVAEMHQDESVLHPTSHSRDIARKYATYIDVKHDRTIGPAATRHHRYEQTFVLGSWYPTLRGADMTALVTHGRVWKQLDTDLLRGTATHVRAHPSLDMWNLMITQLLFMVQGRRSVYYTGSYTTPGNGHDLSLLSGFVAAELIGAAYPFPDEPDAHADFSALRSLMVGAA